MQANRLSSAMFIATIIYQKSFYLKASILLGKETYPMIKHLSILCGLLFILTACSYTMKIQDGEMAVERKQYAVAVDMLKKEYNKAGSRVEKGKIAFLLGTSFEELNQGADAASWFKIAYDNQYGIDALRKYAYSLKQNEEYEEAAAVFRELGLEIGSPYEYRKDIRACEVAADWAAEKRKPYEVAVLPFNSSAAEYAPVLFGNDQIIISSDRSSATGDETYNWTGEAFSDLFIADINGGSVTSFSSAINSEGNEGSASISTDGNTLYFTRCDAPKGEDAYCKIWVSRRISSGEWNEPEVLPFQEAGTNYMHPTISADGKTLYFSSDNSEGWGGFDIFTSTFSEGEWSIPKPMSRSINTSKDEQFPTLDNDTLYFASSGHTGMGGLDIFRTFEMAPGSWAPPINLKTPINSGSDDFGFIVDRRQASEDKDVISQGYFSSRRGEIGGDDIYQFMEKKLPPEPEPEDTAPIVYKNYLDIYVVEKIYQEPGNPNSKVLGRRPLIGATLDIKLDKESRGVTIDEEGKVRLTLRDNSVYGFFASKEEYLNNDARFSSVGLGLDPNNPEQIYEVEIVLEQIFLDQEIVLENIYYDFDESFIRNDAKPTLNELADVLRKNPEISIQLGSHTDCRGPDGYNQTLSRDRAQAAVDYLIENGIEAFRLAAVGYGESKPEADCLCSRCDEDQHQQNRRTTFKILN